MAERVGLTRLPKIDLARECRRILRESEPYFESHGLKVQYHTSSWVSDIAFFCKRAEFSC